MQWTIGINVTLVLNTDKTKEIDFKPKVTDNNSVKLLGVLFASSLTFKTHVPWYNFQKGCQEIYI